MPVSVIVPVLNEEDSIEALIGALALQSRPAEEIVVADGGSTDGTRTILARLGNSVPSLRVVDGPGGISANRNAAIRAATHPIIACTDAGCVPVANWLEALTAPFADGAEWVAGFYRPVGRTAASTAAGAVMMTTLPEIKLENFLPGGSSQAFTKRAWERVGGFPEGSGVGEDTLFGEQLKALGYRPVFAPDAEVAWEPPRTLGEMAEKSYRWGNADGTHQVRSGAYAKVLAAYWMLPLLALLVAVWQPFLGGFMLAAFLALIVYRTRHKYGVMTSPSRFFWIPIAHLRQQWAASAGWIEGYGLGRLVGKLWQRMGGRAPARPRESAPSRHNVELLVRNESELGVWSSRVPDTYQVRVGDPSPEMPIVFATLGDRRGREPSVAPVRVEAEGLRQQDPVARFEELRQTGVPYQLVPTPGGAMSRRDPIAASSAVVVLAAVPLHDVGGGSRGSHIAQQLATQGAHVTYVYRFDAAESVDLGLRFVHPSLEERRWDEFDLESYLPRVTSPQRLVLIEIPHPDYVPMVRRLREQGFTVVLDLIDDWADPALGSNWYRPVVESSMVDQADLLTASAASLQSALAARSGRPVALIPNAVNPRLFDPTRAWARPSDLPPGPIFEYHGSLYGDWFDWDAVKNVAAAYPEATVVLIGDRPRPGPSLPGNVVLLGLKRQSDLAAYLAHTEVALIPFIVSPTTNAVSPLKVYEYLAMGVPVAGPPLHPIVDLAGVSTDLDLVAAVAEARSRPRPDPGSVLELHSWKARVDSLTTNLGWEPSDEGTPVEVRTVTVAR